MHGITVDFCFVVVLRFFVVDLCFLVLCFFELCFLVLFFL